MYRIIVGGILMSGLGALGGPGSAAGPADLRDFEKKFGPPVVRVPRPKAPPVIDGKLDDGCWSAATPVTLGHSIGAWWDPPSQKTEARMVADDKAVYFAVRCFESEPERIVRDGTYQRGMVLRADAVEFFLDPGHKEKRFDYFHVIVTAGEKVHAGRGLEPVTGKTEVAARVGKFEGGWTVEAAVPLSDLGVKEGAIPKVWGVNVCRQRPELAADMPKAAKAAGNKRFDPSQWKLDKADKYRFAEYTCWSLTMAEFSGWPFYADSRPFHFAERFGHALLEAGTQEVDPPARLFEVLYRADFDDGKVGPFQIAAIAADNFRGPGQSLTFAEGKNSIRLAQPLENLDDVTLLLAYRGMPLGDKIVAGGAQHFRISGEAPDGIRCGVERYEVFMTPEVARTRTRLIDELHRQTFKASVFELYDTHADMVRWKPVGRERKGPGPWAMVEGYFAEPSPTQIRWSGGDWAIVRIRLGLFRREPGPKMGQRLVPREQNYPNGLLFAANPKDNIRIDDFIIFRGVDVEPPQRVTGLKLQRQADELELSWNRAKDNTLTAFYRVYAGKELLAETHQLRARLMSAAKEATLSVVAVDLYGNASEPAGLAK